MKRFLIILFFSTNLVHAADPEVRWNSKVTETYQSQAVGAPVSFPVQTPPQVAGMKVYPLVINLNGKLRVDPSEQFPFFQATPTYNRIWGYRAMSNYDAMQVIVRMKNKYPIDADRVYLVGSSAGGSGAMHLAACHPDQFAAVLPLVAAGNNFPLANFKNLPVTFHHGDRDWTSAICNARVQTLRMQALGCPVILKEYPGVGHSVPGSHEPLMAWLFDQKRNATPKTITHDCEALSLGRSYWLTVRELADPHQRAYVEATMKDETVIIHPQNIVAFSLDTHLFPHIKSVQIDQSRLAVGENFQFADGLWKSVAALPERSTRAYEAGAAANLYQGEPLLIVYGTKGDRTSQLRTAASTLAKYGGPDFAKMPGTFPVVADKNLTSEQESNSNLILIGTPAENSISAAILPALPIKIRDNTLVVVGRSKLPLKDQVLSMLYPHPRHPKRLVYLLAPFTDEAGLIQFAENPAKFLAGPDGFDRISQADLLVQTSQHRIARQMQFGKDWKWIRFPDAAQPVPARYANRRNLAINYMELMKAKSNADFALWWGPADQGMWGTDLNDLERYHPDYYTRADFHTQHRLYNTTLGSVSGVELKEIWNRWGTSQELQSIPEISLEAIEDAKQYRLHIPMDLYIRLGQRKKNLGNPKPGPGIPAEEVMVEVFRGTE